MDLELSERYRNFRDEARQWLETNVDTESIESMTSPVIG